jgi:hypothetical protein
MTEQNSQFQQLSPAGWYNDPHNSSQQRYWDGIQWTEHIHQPPPSVLPPSYPDSNHQNQQAPNQNYLGQHNQQAVNPNPYGTPYNTSNFLQQPTSPRSVPKVKFNEMGNTNFSFHTNYYGYYAIAASLIYMFIEFELGLVILGIVPLLMSFRSLMRKEPVRHIAIVLAVVCFLVGIILFKSAQG